MSKDVQLSFEAAIKHLQTTAGYSSEQFETLRRAILAMADNERDTHFAGFAKLLQQELYDLLDQHTHELDIDIAIDHAQWVKQNQLLIAQRAYDLVEHTLEQFEQQYDWGFGTLDSPLDVLQKIPDLTTWPETPTPFLLDRATWPAKDDKQ